MQPDLQTVYSAGSQDVAAQQNKVLRNTYLLLAVSLIPTVIGAVIGTNFINFSFMRSSPIMSVIIMMAVFYGWIFMIEKNRNSSLGVGLLLGFTLFMGLLLAPLLQTILSLRNGGQLVMMAAGGTSAVFFVLSGIAASTKRDFSFLNKFLMVGFVVIMLAVLAQIFLQSPVMQLVLCGAFIGWRLAPSAPLIPATLALGALAAFAYFEIRFGPRQQAHADRVLARMSNSDVP